MAEKPPILFLHGAFAGPEIWTRFVAPWFAARGHEVLAPRLAGPLLGPPARLRDYVGRALDAADRLASPPVVVGHSLGGLVAQHLAARRAVAGTVLVASPGPCGLGPSLWQLSAGAPEVLAALLVTQAGGGALVGRDTIRRALFTEDTPDAWIDGLAMVADRESPLALLDGLTWDLPNWFMVRRAPVLALLGDSDAFVPVTDLWGIAAAYGAETDRMAGFGHGMPIDPRWESLARRIDAWLEARRIGLGRPAATRTGLMNPVAFPAEMR